MLSLETKDKERREAFSRSKFRSRFALNAEDKDYIRKKGLEQIEKHTFEFITKRLQPRHPKKDGRQTPFKGHPAFKAQHATATCCRGCLQKWYGIEKNRVLAADEIAMIVHILMRWIKERI